MAAMSAVLLSTDPAARSNSVVTQVVPLLQSISIFEDHDRWNIAMYWIKKSMGFAVLSNSARLSCVRDDIGEEGIFFPNEMVCKPIGQ